MIVEPVRVVVVLHRGDESAGTGLRVRQEHLPFVIRGTVASTAHHGASAGVCSVVGVDAGLRGVQIERIVRGVMVAGIHCAPLPTDEEPAETASNSLDKIQWVQGVQQGPHAEATTFIAAFAVAVKVGDLSGLAVERVGFPRERPQMEDRKEGHFDVDEKIWKSDFEIGVLDLGGRFDGSGGSEEGDQSLCARLDAYSIGLEGLH